MLASRAADGALTWEPVLVADYDEASGRFLAQPRGPAAGVDQGQQQGSWVPRVSLCFVAEDPFAFARR
jgi:hypothetical protein